MRMETYVYLLTLGGKPDVAYHIGVRLQNLAGEKRLFVIIPRMATSAGTLLACAGDVIFMTPIAELGPVDPQVPVSDTLWVSAKSIGDSLRMVLEIIIEVLQSKKPAGEIQDMLIRAVLSQRPMNAVSHYDSLLAHD
jgi:membrane-bound ClpP family serine protease